MHTKIIVAPPFAPVSVELAYEHLRWDADMEGSPPEAVYPLQSMIERNIETATDFVERRTRRSLVQRTLQVQVPSFLFFSDQYRRSANYAYSPNGGGGSWIELPYPPVAWIASVQYYDSNNSLQTLAASNYFFSDAIVPRAQLTTGFSAPSTYVRDDAVLVTYVAGYVPTVSPATSQSDYAQNVPAALKDAVLIGVQLLSDRFDNPERAALVAARESLLTPYIIRSL